jgi:hypothetical protein
MNALGEMLPWEVEGQDIIDGATVGMFDAGDPAEERPGFCWQTHASCGPHVGGVSASAAVTGAGVAVRGPPEGDEDNEWSPFTTASLPERPPVPAEGTRVSSQVLFDKGTALTPPPTSAAPPTFLAAAPAPPTARRVRAKKANKRRAKKDQHGATSSPIKRSRPSRIWVCQEPECVYTSGRKGAEHSPHRGTPLSSRDLLEVERVSDPVCVSHLRPPRPVRLQATLSDT